MGPTMRDRFFFLAGRAYEYVAPEVGVELFAVITLLTTWVALALTLSYLRRLRRLLRELETDHKRRALLKGPR